MTNATSAQGYVADSRNDAVEIYVDGRFYPRGEARVSIFDAGFVLGDGVWEGLRLVDGHLLAVDAHMSRLYEGARSIQLDIGLTPDQLVDEVYRTVARNRMDDGVHIRLMVTRGIKSTPNQDPRFALGKPTIVIVAEYKTPTPEARRTGIRLMTSAIRCSTPDVFDLRLNSHSRLNFIQALIQATNMGADEALMLDSRGFVASCNSTNFFIVRGRELWTSTGACCFNGITRSKVIDLYRKHGARVCEKDFTLAEVYGADEAFVTGTLGGVTPVATVDARRLAAGVPGPVTTLVALLYEEDIRGSAAKARDAQKVAAQ